MKTHQRTLCFLAFAGLLSGLAAQGTIQVQSMVFKDHDQTTRPLTSIPVLRTGNFVGDLIVKDGTGQVVTSGLSYAWAYYWNNGILNEPANDNLQWVFKPPRGQASMLIPGQQGYPISLPMGTPGYMDLPVATLQLRIWVGHPGQFTFNPAGAPSGFLASVTIPVTITNVPFGLWIRDPRHQTTGAKVDAQVVTSTPVSQDTYFTLTGQGSVDSTVAQVVIKQGDTSTAMFKLQLSAVPGQGRMVVTRQTDSAQIVSGEMSNGSTCSTGTAVAEDDDEEHPEIHVGYYYFERCLFPGSPGGFGMGTKACGECAETPVAPPICNHGVEEFTAEPNPPKCGDITPWWDCEIFEEWTSMSTYKIDGSIYGERCGSGSTETNDESTVSGGVEVTTGPVTTSGSGSSGSSKKTNENNRRSRKCCELVYAGQTSKYIDKCRSVD